MPGGSSDDDEKVGGSSGDEGKAYADQGLGGGEPGFTQVSTNAWFAMINF